MIIVKKSKYSDPLCPHCPHKDKCKAYQDNKDKYDVLACAMTGPQDEFLKEDFYKC